MAPQIAATALHAVCPEWSPSTDGRQWLCEISTRSMAGSYAGLKVADTMRLRPHDQMPRKVRQGWVHQHIEPAHLQQDGDMAQPVTVGCC